MELTDLIIEYRARRTTANLTKLVEEFYELGDCLNLIKTYIIDEGNEELLPELTNALLNKYCKHIRNEKLSALVSKDAAELTELVYFILRNEGFGYYSGDYFAMVNYINSAPPVFIGVDVADKYEANCALLHTAKDIGLLNLSNKQFKELIELANNDDYPIEEFIANSYGLTHIQVVCMFLTKALLLYTCEEKPKSREEEVHNVFSIFGEDIV